MKSRDAIYRKAQFKYEEKARKVADLERTIGEFETMAEDLDRQIEAEHDRTGVRDPVHVLYSTFAKSAAHRLQNLRASIVELRAKLELARRERAEAFARASALKNRDSAKRNAAGAGPYPILA